jgi:putative ABC transport system permease protein
MILRWVWALVRRRAGRLTAVTAGVMMAVALLAGTGSFLSASKATMTERAVARVAVDWQVQVAEGADPARVAGTLAEHPGTRTTDVVGFASVPGLAATTPAPGGGTTVQRTGAAKVLGLPSTYRADFPG